MGNTITFSDKLKLVSFILSSDKFTNGPKVKQFEKQWCDWSASKYSLFVSSGSTANSLLIQSIKEYYGLNDGDKVLVPACTWITSITPILQANLLPIFCDVSLDNYCMSEEDMITISRENPDIKLVFTTHLLGYYSDIEKIKEIFPNAIIAEDCCEAHGVTDHDGNITGKHSVGCTYSFYYGHHMTTVEGGIVTTNNYDLYNLMRMKRSHGLAREATPEVFDEMKSKYPDIIPSFLFTTDGYNFRNTEIAAVLGLQQIKRLNSIVKNRNLNYKKYYEIISSRTDLFYIPDNPVNKSSFAFPFVCKNFVTYHKLQDALMKNNIEYRPVIAGNLLRQPFLAGRKFTYHKDFYNVDILHDQGLYVGNNHLLNNSNFKMLSKIIKDL